MVVMEFNQYGQFLWRFKEDGRERDRTGLKIKPFWEEP